MSQRGLLSRTPHSLRRSGLHWQSQASKLWKRFESLREAAIQDVVSRRVPGLMWPKCWVLGDPRVPPAAGRRGGRTQLQRGASLLRGSQAFSAAVEVSAIAPPPPHDKCARGASTALAGRSGKSSPIKNNLKPATFPPLAAKWTNLGFSPPQSLSSGIRASPWRAPQDLYKTSLFFLLCQCNHNKENV